MRTKFLISTIALLGAFGLIAILSVETITAKGSDTMGRRGQKWAERYTSK